MSRCIKDKIDGYHLESLDFDSHILHFPSEPDEPKNRFLHFVGNGVIGSETRPDSPLYIKSERVLSMAVPFQPIVSVFLDHGDHGREASVIQYIHGLAQKVQCIPSHGSCITVTHQIYAHRTIPSLLVQDIKITNPTDQDVILSTERTGLSKWLTSVVNPKTYASFITSWSHLFKLC